MMQNTDKAVILLSGGLDSATAMAVAKSEGFTPYALSFRYGQRHKAELEAAAKVAAAQGVAEHKIADIDLRLFGGSALTAEIDVPKARSAEEIGQGIPVTYVPARNTIFLSFALAWAEVLGAYDIFIGVNALDYSGYPDCRPEFIRAYEEMANLATAYGVEQGTGMRGRLEGGAACQHIENRRIRIHTPLIDLTKAEIIRRGLELGVDYGLTLSCYDPSPEGKPCGQCDSCLLRKKGFSENGMTDPTSAA